MSWKTDKAGNHFQSGGSGVDSGMIGNMKAQDAKRSRGGGNAFKRKCTICGEDGYTSAAYRKGLVNNISEVGTSLGGKFYCQKCYGEGIKLWDAENKQRNTEHLIKYLPHIYRCRVDQDYQICKLEFDSLDALRSHIMNDHKPTDIRKTLEKHERVPID